jgi:3-dehydro-L-gulonate 2-dehydrogenase
MLKASSPPDIRRRSRRSCRMNIPKPRLVKRIRELLLQRQVGAETAELCATVIAESTADGVISHGIARLPRLLEQIDAGEVDPSAAPVLLEAPAFPGVERYDGRGGIGIVNAAFATDRAVALAAKNGIGMVTMRNTSHWLRASTYGWRAVDSGCALICWTNTTANMPAWGSDRPVIGNNPLVIAVPGTGDEDSLVVDMAMSQFSWGRIGETRRAGKQLEVAGGWNGDGELTRDPGEILDSGLALPAGYWKGSALSMVLDLFAAALSGGRASADIPPIETTNSQVFIAVRMGDGERSSLAAELKQLSERLDESRRDGFPAPRYPGQSSIARRRRSDEVGIEIPDELWNRIDGN